MIEALEVHNFQSLSHVRVELGALTTIVGPSSSGKSAVVRALKLLASNSRGTPYVSHGAKVAKVAGVNQEWIVQIERGEGVGNYKLINRATGEESLFTKLGGAVPDQVTDVLRIRPFRESSIHFAGQFDRPYLLDDSGSEVARVLGELTRVSVIFAAAREANRRRQQASSTLRTRQADLNQLLEQAKAFKDLPQRRQALDEAEAELETATQLDAKVSRLRSLSASLDVATSALARAEEQLAQSEPPSLADVEAALERKTRCVQLLRALVADSEALVRLEEEELRVDAELVALEERVHSTLVEAGECPLCGQSTRELQLA